MSFSRSDLEISQRVSIYPHMVSSFCHMVNPRGRILVLNLCVGSALGIHQVNQPSISLCEDSFKVVLVSKLNF